MARTSRRARANGTRPIERNPVPIEHTFAAGVRAVSTAVVAVAAVALVVATALPVGGQTHRRFRTGRRRPRRPIKHVVVIFDENISLRPLLRRPTRRRRTPTARRSSATDQHAEGQQPGHVGRADQQPEPLPRRTGSPPTQAADLRPEPQLRCRSRRPRTAARWTSSSRTSASTPAPATVRRTGPDHGLLRRQHRHRRCGTTPSSSPCPTTRSASTFGPSTPGALNLISGQTHGFQRGRLDDRQQPTTDSYAVVVAGRQRRRHGHQRPRPGLRRLLGQQPHRRPTTSPRRPGKNIGDLLNATRRDLGLVPGRLRADHAYAGAGRLRSLRRDAHQHRRRVVDDYSPHHNPFEYYASTSNPHHLPPIVGGRRSGTPTRPTTSTT